MKVNCLKKQCFCDKLKMLNFNQGEIDGNSRRNNNSNLYK